MLVPLLSPSSSLDSKSWSWCCFYGGVGGYSVAPPQPSSRPRAATLATSTTATTTAPGPGIATAPASAPPPSASTPRAPPTAASRGGRPRRSFPERGHSACLRTRSRRCCAARCGGCLFGDGEEDPEDGSRHLTPCTGEMRKKWEGRGRGVAGGWDRSGSGRREPRGGGRGGGVEEEAAVEGVEGAPRGGEGGRHGSGGSNRDRVRSRGQRCAKSDEGSSGRQLGPGRDSWRIFLDFFGRASIGTALLLRSRSSLCIAFCSCPIGTAMHMHCSERAYGRIILALCI